MNKKTQKIIVALLLAVVMVVQGIFPAFPVHAESVGAKDDVILGEVAQETTETEKVMQESEATTEAATEATEAATEATEASTEATEAATEPTETVAQEEEDETESALLAADKTQDVIKSGTMEVTVSKNFPTVISYTLNGNTLQGNAAAESTVHINGKPYTPTVTYAKTAENKAEYVLNVSELNVSMTICLTVTDNVLKFEAARIDDEGEGRTRVETIEFAQQRMVSVNSNEPGAFLISGTSADDQKTVVDANATVGVQEAGLAVVNNDRLAASISNNTILNTKYVRAEVVAENGKTAFLRNVYWRYRYPVKAEYNGDYAKLPLPWCKVVITGDANGDNTVDWQDGAVAHREKIKNDIYSGDPEKGILPINQVYPHIVTDFASLSQWSFAKTLDDIKKMYYLMDGFGQQIEFKGYQSEGHDSAHPDYGNNTGRAMGGLEDFNKLLTEARKYNANVGIHINNTEIYPEAKYYNPDSLLKDEKGDPTEAWGWIDTSMLVDRFYDAASGDLEHRLTEMQNNYPDLGFVYMDVYTGYEWEAYVLSQKIQSQGIPMWTEFVGPLNQYAQWTHQAWGKGMLDRMIYNGEKDVYGNDRLLMGRGRTGTVNPMGMRNTPTETIDHSVEYFYSYILPYRYLMNFHIMKLTDEHAILTNGVETKVEGDTVNMYKDGKLIARNINPASANGGSGAWSNSYPSQYTVVELVPWDPMTEEKLYHWNYQGGESTWELPASWDGVTSAKLYKNTDTGRVFVEDVPVVNGQVTLHAQAKTGYSLYKTEAPAQQSANWGEISPVKDNGFDSHSFDYWKASSSKGAVDHIVMHTLTADEISRGSGILLVKGGDDAVISQSIDTLKPNTWYSASVWADIEGNRPVTLEVSGLGETVYKTIDFTCLKNLDYISDKFGTNFERIRVDFYTGSNVSGGTISLKIAAGQGEVRLDDVRIMELSGEAAQKGHYFYEDFEHTDFGWGPFTYGVVGGGLQTHLSEANHPYTTDTINGNFSLKTTSEPNGEVYRTTPTALKFAPNTDYTMTFLYQADQPKQYTVEVRSATGGPSSVVASADLSNAGQFQISFRTGNYDDYIVSFRKNFAFNDGQGYLLEKNRLVIDDFAIDVGAKNVGVSSVKIDDQDKMVKSEGSWVAQQQEECYMGSEQYSNIKGDYKEFTFTGTAISVVGSKQQNAGKAQVYIDGQLVDTIDTYSAQTQNQAVLFSKAGLENKKHTIKIVVTGESSGKLGAYILIDAFEQIMYQEAKTGSGVTIVDNEDPALKLTGNWTKTENIYAYQGSFDQTDDKAAAAEYSFEGVAAKVFAHKGPDMGVVDVYVDGVKKSSVDLHAANACNEEVFAIDGLAFATHTIKLVPQRGTVSIDKLEVFSGTVTIDDSDFSFEGTWTRAEDPNSYNNTICWSNQKNSAASVTFEGRNVRVYGNMQRNAGKIAIYIDGKLEREVLLTSAETIRKLLFEKNGLPEGKHTIQIVTLAEGNPDYPTDASMNYSVLDCVEFDTYPKESVGENLVEKINVSAIDGKNEITVVNGTLQMVAEVLPENAKDKTVTWSVVGEDNQATMLASITKDGLLSAKDNGTVIVRAGANDGSGVKGEAKVVITNQLHLEELWDDTDERIRYTGPWSTWSDTCYHNGTVHYMNDPVVDTASYEFEFEGTGFALIQTQAWNTVPINIFIDGAEEPVKVETISKESIFQQAVYENRDLKNGKHTVKVTFDEIANPSQFCLDAVKVYFAAPETVDKTALENLIKDSESLNKDAYTEASWAKFEAALNAAKEVLNKQDATQAEVNEAIENLQKAKVALDEKDVVDPTVDPTEEPTEGPTEPSEGDTNTPAQTGDSSNILMWTLIAFASAVMLIVLCESKKYSRR